MAGKRRKRAGAGVSSGESNCSQCKGRCCKYFALPIPEPETWRDFDDIRWYLAHEKASAFVDEGTWYLLVDARCRHLTVDHRCAIYDHRPRICRGYSDKTCEFHDEDGSVYDMLFETSEQIWEYAEAMGPRGKRPAW